jgi:hypothetical protein
VNLVHTTAFDADPNGDGDTDADGDGGSESETRRKSIAFLSPNRGS